MPDAPGHIHCPVCGHKEPGSREEHLARIASDARNRCWWRWGRPCASLATSWPVTS